MKIHKTTVNGKVFRLSDGTVLQGKSDLHMWRFETLKKQREAIALY